MKSAFLLLAGLALAQANAQILHPVHWTYSAKKISATEAEVYFKATIDADWHVYSQHVRDGGPVKTTFTFTSSPDYATVGQTVEPTPITRMEPVFNMEIGYFEHAVTFRQKVHLRAGKTTVTGTLEYMTCNDKQCLPPEDLNFSIPIQ